MKVKIGETRGQILDAFLDLYTKGEHEFVLRFQLHRGDKERSCRVKVSQMGKVLEEIGKLSVEGWK
jgi:hypothetical protein